MFNPTNNLVHFFSVFFNFSTCHNFFFFLILFPNQIRTLPITDCTIIRWLKQKKIVWNACTGQRRLFELFASYRKMSRLEKMKFLKSKEMEIIRPGIFLYILFWDTFQLSKCIPFKCTNFNSFIFSKPCPFENYQPKHLPHLQVVCPPQHQQLPPLE